MGAAMRSPRFAGGVGSFLQGRTYPVRLGCAPHPQAPTSAKIFSSPYFVRGVQLCKGAPCSVRRLIPLAGPYLKGDSTPCWRFGVSQSPAYPAQPTCQGAKFSVWLGASLGPTATYTSRGTPLQSLECCFAGPNPYATRRSDPSLTIASRLGRFRARLRPPSTSRKSMREYFVRRAQDAHPPNPAA